MKSLRHFGSLLLVVLAFAMGQHAALLHELAHALDRVSHQDPKLPAPSACADCGLVAQLTGMPGSTAPVVAPHAADLVPALYQPTGIVARATVAFDSRGPPQVS